MARTEEIAIDLDSLTAQERADASAIASLGGVDLATTDLADLAAIPVPALTALIYVIMRRTAPRITPGRCVRLALLAKGVTDG